MTLPTNLSDLSDEEILLGAMTLEAMDEQRNDERQSLLQSRQEESTRAPGSVSTIVFNAIPAPRSQKTSRVHFISTFFRRMLGTRFIPAH